MNLIKLGYVNMTIAMILAFTIFSIQLAPDATLTEQDIVNAMYEGKTNMPDSALYENASTNIVSAEEDNTAFNPFDVVTGVASWVSRISQVVWMTIMPLSYLDDITDTSNSVFLNGLVSMIIIWLQLMNFYVVGSFIVRLRK